MVNCRNEDCICTNLKPDSQQADINMWLCSIYAGFTNYPGQGAVGSAIQAVSAAIYENG